MTTLNNVSVNCVLLLKCLSLIIKSLWHELFKFIFNTFHAMFRYSSSFVSRVHFKAARHNNSICPVLRNNATNTMM